MWPKCDQIQPNFNTLDEIGSNHNNLDQVGSNQFKLTSLIHIWIFKLVPFFLQMNEIEKFMNAIS